MWFSVTSSANGAKLAAVVWNGQIYTSTDSGVTWTPRDLLRNWISVASSSDGTTLIAAEGGGHLFVSTDSGISWIQQGVGRGWSAVASSADGTRLVAVDYGGKIYASVQPLAPTIGTAGYISGDQYEAVAVQYIGAGVFMVISHEGSLTVN